MGFEASWDSETRPRSPPEAEVWGSSEKFMAREPKSSPESTRFLMAWIFLRASASDWALLPWRLLGRAAGRPVTRIWAMWYWFSMLLNSALCWV